MSVGQTVQCGVTRAWEAGCTEREREREREEERKREGARLASRDAVAGGIWGSGVWQTVEQRV